MTSIFSALLTAFNLLMHPKLLLLALWPMLASVVVWVGAALFFWGRWAAGLNALLQNTVLQKWVAHGIGATLSHFLVNVLLFVLLLSVIYLTALVITALFAMPTIVTEVAETYYPDLEALRGGTIGGNIKNTAVAMGVFCAAWLVSLPLWLFSPLAMVLPVVLSAYLNQRLFRYDALAEHASEEEYVQVVERSRKKLYLLGAVAGLLQFVPVLNLFLPMYMGLAFTYLCLYELRQLRQAA